MNLRLLALIGLWTTALCNRASKTKIFYLHIRRTLASISSDYKHLTPNHTISFQNLFTMIRSLNGGFAEHKAYVQNMA